MQGRLACDTTIARAAPAQLEQLQAMAQAQKVVLIPLQCDCDAVLVPYLDGQRLKLVTFLAELALSAPKAQ